SYRGKDNTFGRRQPIPNPLEDILSGFQRLLRSGLDHFEPLNRGRPLRSGGVSMIPQDLAYQLREVRMPGRERHDAPDNRARETKRALPLSRPNEIVSALGIQHRYTLRQ